MSGNKKKYNFILVFDGISDPDTDLADALFEAGCDDATLSFRDQIAYLEFDREADSLQDAIVSAISNLLDAGLDIEINSVEPGDYVTTSEIAHRLNISRQYVQLLKSGKRGSGVFPPPVSGIKSGTQIFSWARIVQFLYSQGRLNKRIDENEILRARLIKYYNDLLEKHSNANSKYTVRSLLKDFRSVDPQRIDRAEPSVGGHSEST